MGNIFDAAIAISLGVVLIELARFGGFVSANPPSTSIAANRYTIRFRLYAAFAVCLVIAQGFRIYQASEEATKSQMRLTSSIVSLNTSLQRAETGRQVDNSYLKAKLEDAYRLNDQFREVGPALMKMAQISAEYSKKQYENKTTTDKQLREFTRKVVGRIRDLQGQYASAGVQLSNQLRTARQSYSGKEDQIKEVSAKMQNYIQQEELLRSQYEQIYRAGIMADAAYARRELLSRIGGDNFLPQRDKTKYIAIDGIFAGPDPIGESADYLEALVRKLPE